MQQYVIQLKATDEGNKTQRSKPRSLRHTAFKGYPVWHIVIQFNPLMPIKQETWESLGQNTGNTKVSEYGNEKSVVNQDKCFTVVKE